MLNGFAAEHNDKGFSAMGVDIGTEWRNPSTSSVLRSFIIARPTSELLFEIGVFLFCFCPLCKRKFYAVRSLFLVMP